MADLVFGKYEIIRRLAVGGMGEIFLARQVGEANFERLVILKSLLPDGAEDQEEERVQAFLGEARVAASLNHPNIVGIYELGAWNGVYFIAMEYIEGDDLSALMVSSTGAGRLMPPPVAARIIRDAALGLAHAHASKDARGQVLDMVHRDISPHNIMVRVDGVTKVVDFGIARVANRQARTATGLIKGKLRYMSPEQLGAGDLDGRSDQFSLGIVLWELVASRRIFRNDSDVDVIMRLTRADTPPLDSVCKDAPPELVEITARMLALKPEDRYPSCREVAQALSVYLERHTVDSTSDTVGKLVSELRGAAISKRTADLTPVAQNFLLSLDLDSDGTATTVAPSGSGAMRNKVAGLAVVLVLAAVAGWWFVLGAASLAPEVAPVAPVAEKLPEPAPRRPHVELTSVPTGATVSLGDKILGKTPLQIDSLDPGDHEVVIELAGWKPTPKKLSLVANRDYSVSVSLEREAAVAKKGSGRKRSTRQPRAPVAARTAPAAAKATADGFLTLRTEPWTRVTIDGVPYGSTPFFKRRLAPGKHEMHLANDAEGVSTKRRITIVSGKPLKLDLTLTGR